MLIPLVVSSVLAAGPFNPSVELPDAQPTACGAAVTAISVAASPACFTADASPSLRIKLASADRHVPINAWRYAIRPLNSATATASGQYIDGVGQAEWEKVLPLPRGDTQTTTVELSLGIESGDRHAQRTLYIERVVRANVARSWAIAGASIRLAPEGCWMVVPGALMTLSLEACDNKLRAIKAVVVKPVDGVTLGQYVTHSIEAYSQADIWRVNRRGPLPAAVGDGEVIELVQTIAGDTRSIVKYFVQQQERILIVSRYEAVSQPVDASDTSFLVVPAP